jgi:hypothetical protein
VKHFHPADSLLDLAHVRQQPQGIRAPRVDFLALKNRALALLKKSSPGYSAMYKVMERHLRKVPQTSNIPHYTEQ